MSTDTLQPEQLTPPMILDSDSPRVHRHDPLTSHLAADKSQRTVRTVRERVLQILAERGPMAAFEVCDIYAHRAKSQGWPRVHHESPRKRMSDMKQDGLLVDTGATRVNSDGSPEVVVALADHRAGKHAATITPERARSTFRHPETPDRAIASVETVAALADVVDFVEEPCS